MTNLRSHLFFAAASVCFAGISAAESLPDMVQAELLPGWRTDAGTHIAGLRLTLASGWKTYWRAPGDGGIPPEFNWTGSENLGGFAVSWPVPQVFLQNGMRSIGYQDEVTFPLEFRALEAGTTISVAGDVDIGVCEEVCVPMTLSVRAELPATQTRPDPAIIAALANRPMTHQEAGVTEVRCRLEPIRDGMRVSATIEMPAMGGTEDAVIELTGAPVWVSEATLMRDGNRLVAEADLVPPEATPFMIDRSELRFTILSGGGAVDIEGCSG